MSVHSLALTVTSHPHSRTHGRAIYYFRLRSDDALRPRHTVLARHTFASETQLERARTIFVLAADAVASPCKPRAGAWACARPSTRPEHFGVTELPRVHETVAHWETYARAGYDISAHVTDLERIVAARDLLQDVALGDAALRTPCDAALAACIQSITERINSEVVRYRRAQFVVLFDEAHWLVTVGAQADAALSNVLRQIGIGKRTAEGWLWRAL